MQALLAKVIDIGDASYTCCQSANHTTTQLNTSSHSTKSILTHRHATT